MITPGSTTVPTHGTTTPSSSTTTPSGGTPFSAVGTVGGYSPRNPAPRRMGAGVWWVLFDTVLGVLVLTSVTTYWGGIFQTSPLRSIPVTIGLILGVLWAAGAGSRSPLNILIPTVITMVAAFLTNGDGLLSLLPFPTHPMLREIQGGGVVFGSTGLLFAALFTLILAVGAMMLARHLGFRAESLEQSRIAAIRRSARVHHEGNPYAEREEEEGRTPPPSRMATHIVAAFSGVLFAFLAYGWYGLSLGPATFSHGSAVPWRSLILLMITGSAVLMGSVSSWGPWAAALTTFLVPILLLDLRIIPHTYDGLVGALYPATLYGYHYIMVPILVFSATMIRSARRAGREDARTPAR